MKIVSTFYVAYFRKPESHTPVCVYPQFHMHTKRQVSLQLFMQGTGKQKNSELHGSKHSWYLSDLNFFVNVILACCYYSQIFKCHHISKGLTSYLRNVPLPCIVVKRKGTHLADNCDTVPLYYLDCYWLQSGLLSSCQLSHTRPICGLSRMTCRIMWGVQNSI